MKKAILSVSYGTCDKAQLEDTIARVEDLYGREFPDFEVFRAFTSKHVIASLKKAGVHVDTVSEALERLKKAGFDEVYIQPTHIICGGEYDGIVEHTHLQSGSFARLRVGRPLLDREEDNEYICNFFENELAAANLATVLMGHGSEHPDNIKYAKLQATAKRLGYGDIFVMTLEAQPSVNDIIPMLREAGYSKVLLTPLLFGAAGHARRDMAGDEPGSVASILRSEGFEVECLVRGLGEYDAFAELYAAHLRRAIES